MKDNSGPAFSVNGFITTPDRDVHDYQIELSGGMTLRDYFAAKAMQGLMTSYASAQGGHESLVKATAVISYQISDAMLAEREK